MATKKVKSAGRFGARYGSKVRERVTAIESKQRKKQLCPFCKKLKAKSVSRGIWVCKNCGKRFASRVYYLE